MVMEPYFMQARGAGPGPLLVASVCQSRPGWGCALSVHTSTHDVATGCAGAALPLAAAVLLSILCTSGRPMPQLLGAPPPSLQVDNTFNKLQTLCEYIDDTEVGGGSGCGCACGACASSSHALFLPAWHCLAFWTPHRSKPPHSTHREECRSLCACCAVVVCGAVPHPGQQGGSCFCRLHEERAVPACSPQRPSAGELALCPLLGK